MLEAVRMPAREFRQHEAVIFFRASWCETCRNIINAQACARCEWVDLDIAPSKWQQRHDYYQDWLNEQEGK
jgi:thiol-disulfide isomerase/thioredoxin